MSLHDDNGKTIPTPAEFVVLGKRVLEGDRAAINELVERNLGLIRGVAFRYYKGHPYFDDLLAQGAIGLIRAAEKWDYRKAAFSTYAWWWVHQAMSRYIDDTYRDIRIPTHVSEDRRRFLKLQTELGSEATDEEVAGLLGLNDAQLERILQAGKLKTTSLDAEVDGTDLHGIIGDRSSPDAFTELDAELEDTRFWKVVDALPKNERNAFILYHGLGYDEPRSFEEVGIKLGEYGGKRSPSGGREKARRHLKRAHELIAKELGIEAPMPSLHLKKIRSSRLDSLNSRPES